MLTPLAPPPERCAADSIKGTESAHRSITEFASFETLAFGESAQNDRADGAHDDAYYRHRLVQRDARGREYVVVHAVCLDFLEELVSAGDGTDGNGTNNDGTADERAEWQPLSYEASQAFLETLLSEAAAPPHLALVDWKPGDVVVFDNVQTQHSVTPTDAYATVDGMRRLMTRTALQPMVDVLSR